MIFKDFKTILVFFLFLATPAWAGDRILISVETQTNSKNRDIHLTYVVHYPYEPHEVWAILSNPERYEATFPRFLESHVLGAYPRKDPTRARKKVYTKVDLPWPMPDVWNHLYIDLYGEIPQFLRWRRLRGSFRKNRGTIQVSPNEYGCKMVLTIWANPGSGVPQWIVAWGIRSYLPDLIQALGRSIDESRMEKTTQD